MPEQRILNVGDGMVQVDDYIVDKKVLDVIERIRAYDDNLDVMYLNPDKADFLDAPWVVIERCADGFMRKVFDVWEMNDKVLERLFNADTRRVDVLLNVDRANQAIKNDQQRRFREKTAESADKLAHLLAHPKTTYKVKTDSQLLTIDDKFGVTKREDLS